jgi:hypothetical protein
MDSGDLPLPDDPCGRHFRYRDLIEVGTAWNAHRIDISVIRNATRAMSNNSATEK